MECQECVRLEADCRQRRERFEFAKARFERLEKLVNRDEYFRLRSAATVEKLEWDMAETALKRHLEMHALPD
jgi:hypothetical protein